ncbi:MAG: chromosomal replication initiator protein DnaA [Verrucomicrobiaceae bacterium]|nr:chromosomal replication initiator protein DnaA [Verrucomicrobiaceae bacterium]
MSEVSALTWAQLEPLIAKRVSQDTMTRWFANTSIAQTDDTNIVLEVPNQIYQFWIETNYTVEVNEAIEEACGKRRLSFQFRESDPLAAATPQQPTTPRPVPTEAAIPQPGSRKSKAGQKATSAGLNHRYLFESFVVGANNEFAHAACQAAASKPGRIYNPLFIYGGAGMGKTHLMHAIGHSILEERPSAKVVYIASEQFTNEFIQAISDGSLVKFRQQYREADVLLIDDIQFFAKKEKSQEEFFHTFNTLCDKNGKQIVMTSDMPASKIKNLEKRLVSRFEWGLTAEMAPPDTETRIATLKRKAQEMCVEVDGNILEFIAQRIRNNVRRLEGALIRLASFGSMNNGHLDLKAVEHLLQDFLHDEGSKDVTISQIQKRVAEFYDIRLSDILGRKRPAQIALARQVAMFFSRELTGSSYQEIGDAFGGRDHGTVIHACRSVEAKCRDLEKVRRQVDRLHGEFTETPER